ncbi:MAG: hypothetical protein IKV50_04810, partial [Clostridia bacterium]|nr:hypothetical protein [Clostridia bacterium]
ERLAKLWLENPIEKWVCAYASQAQTTKEMVDSQLVMVGNWLREMEESLAYIKECYPEYGAKLEEEQLLWKEAATLRSSLAVDLLCYANSYGTIALVYQATERSELCRERAFRLFYIETVCMETKGDTAHVLELQMIVPEGMEAEYDGEVTHSGFDNYYWTLMDSEDFETLIADNPIDAWAEEYQGASEGYTWYAEVLITNWKREMEESIAHITACFPEMKEQLEKEAAAWGKGILGQDFLGLSETLGIKTDVHEMLALQETVEQYRRRALFLFCMETACVECQELSERPADFVPEIELILPKK